MTLDVAWVAASNFGQTKFLVEDFVRLQGMFGGHRTSATELQRQAARFDQGKRHCRTGTMAGDHHTIEKEVIKGEVKAAAAAHHGGGGHGKIPYGSLQPIRKHPSCIRIDNELEQTIDRDLGTRDTSGHLPVVGTRNL